MADVSLFSQVVFPEGRLGLWATITFSACQSSCLSGLGMAMAAVTWPLSGITATSQCRHLCCVASWAHGVSQALGLAFLPSEGQGSVHFVLLSCTADAPGVDLLVPSTVGPLEPLPVTSSPAGSLYPQGCSCGLLGVLRGKQARPRQKQHLVLSLQLLLPAVTPAWLRRH